MIFYGCRFRFANIGNLSKISQKFYKFLEQSNTKCLVHRKFAFDSTNRIFASCDFWGLQTFHVRCIETKSFDSAKNL